MPDVDPHEPATVSGLTTEEIFDLLATRVAFDPANPRWTPELERLHRHSLEKRLVILPAFFYTPVYAPADIPEKVWAGRFDAGARYDADEQIALMEETHRFRDELETFEEEPSAPEPETRRYFWRNSEFSHGDAVLYYSLLRHLRPRRVVEVGGGFSTLLASAAAERNGDTGVTCIEPHPKPFLAAGLPRVTLERTPAQDIPPEFFDTLEAGDVLFIDSSHVCKTGSDVNHLYLRVLPRLRRGVWVHAHDIFLPFEYPKPWAEQLLYWNEQYLMAALLANSRKYKIAVANHFLQSAAPERLSRFGVPARGVAAGGASFWIRAIE